MAAQYEDDIGGVTKILNHKWNSNKKRRMYQVLWEDKCNVQGKNLNDKAWIGKKSWVFE